MKDLCTRFCHAELLAATGAVQSNKRSQNDEDMDVDEYEQEEPEEDE